MDPNDINNLSWISPYKDFLLVFIGGLCAAFGGFVSTWYTARNARKIKMEETIGQQKVDIYKKALRLINKLRSISIQGDNQDILNFINEENDWVLDNEILLPQTFAECWHSVRSNVRSMEMKKESLSRLAEGKEQEKLIAELDKLFEFVQNLIQNAEEDIRKELGLKPFKIRRPQKSPT